MIKELLPRYVVDASIVVKWYSKSKEDDLGKADSLLDGHIQRHHLLLAPSLVFYELANALRFNPNFDEKDVLEALSVFNDLGIKIINFEKIYSQAISLAFNKDLTVYHAVYVAISRLYKIPFVTADFQLHQKLKDLLLLIPLSQWEL